MRTPKPTPWLAVVAAIAICVGKAPGQAVPTSQQHLKNLYQSKLVLPYLKNADWLLDYDDAKAAAKKRGKLIFAYFTRSDERCQSSMLMECGTLAESGFKKFSGKVVPLCHITTRVEGHEHADLFAAKGGLVYPMMLFMDAKGAVVYRVKGETLADIEKGLSELEELAELRTRVEAGDKSLRFAFLTKRLDLGAIEYPAAKKARKRVGKLSKSQLAELELRMLDSEVLYIARCAKTLKDKIKAGEKFFKMKKKERIPTPKAIQPFWQMMLFYAAKREDVDLYEEAVDSLAQDFVDLDLKAERRHLRAMRLKKMK